MINLTKVKIEDAEEFHKLLYVCSEELHNNGIDMWWPPYSLESIKKDILNPHKDVNFIKYENNNVGTVIFSFKPPTYYDSSIWGDNTLKAIYPTKLSVLPEYRNINIGLWCIKQYPKIAEKFSASLIRVDIYEKNLLVINIHKTLNYEFVGVAKTRRFKVHCMQKQI